MTQAVAGIPLTVYGKGGQTRGALHILDTLQCVELALENPAKEGEYRVFNQFTEQFSVMELAHKVRDVAMDMGINRIQIDQIENPRHELEEHYYNAENSNLLDLGLEPHYLTPERLADMMMYVEQKAAGIDVDQILPKVKWSA